jgi:hypothetical protein
MINVFGAPIKLDKTGIYIDWLVKHYDEVRSR